MALTIIRNSVMKQCYECEGAYAFSPAQMLTVLPFGWLFYLHGTLTVETFVTVIILSLGMSAPIVAAFNFVDTLAQVDEILKAEEQVHGDTPVAFVGHDLKDIPLTELYDQVAFVSQDNYLFDDTVRENIRMGCCDATDAQVEAAAHAAGCDSFISGLEQGFDTMVGGGGAYLSGGERQRIAIARAMLKDAPIIVLDEATAYIDPENEDRLQKAIEALTRNKTILMIAHRLKTVRSADQILVLDGGRSFSMVGTRN